HPQAARSFRENKSHWRLALRRRRPRDSADLRVESESLSPARSSVPTSRIESYQHLLRRSASCSLLSARPASSSPVKNSTNINTTRIPHHNHKDTARSSLRFR